MININTANFKTEILESKIPVIVDFWAPWCGPCQMLTPIIKDIAQELEGRVKVVKLNIDENQDLARQYGVTSIPTVILFDTGQVKQTLNGLQSKQAYLQLVNAN